jgi:hypothetical protein
MSAIEKPLHIICDGFPGFSHFVDQTDWNFFHVATVITTNSIDTPILRAPRRKEGQNTRPDSRTPAVRSIREPGPPVIAELKQFGSMRSYRIRPCAHPSGKKLLAAPSIRWQYKDSQAPSHGSSNNRALIVSGRARKFRALRLRAWQRSHSGHFFKRPLHLLDAGATNASAGAGAT